MIERIYLLLHPNNNIYIMKQNRQTLFVLTGVLLLALGMLVFFVYQSGVENREGYKEKTETLLKSTAELWVNQEFEKLGVPYSSSGGEPVIKSRIRRRVFAKDTIVVEVDSVKEAKLLFTSWALNTKLNFLLLMNDSSICALGKQWQESLHVTQLPGDCVLELFNEQPGVNKQKRIVAGDSIFISEANILGEYYLDNLYFFRLVSYLSVPSIWKCADWGEPGNVLCYIVIALVFFTIVSLLLYNWKKERDSRPSVLNNIVTYMGEDKYKIGDMVFDEKERILTFNDGTFTHLPEQGCKLFSALIHADKCYLPYKQVTKICGWNDSDEKLGDKRRMAFKNLRILLKIEKSHVSLVSEKKKGVYLVIVN